MQILISNDDGIQAPGLRILAEFLSEIAEIFVVAPDGDRSASSHSLSMRRPVRVKQIQNNFYAVDGTPSDCINLAVNAILPSRPDMVVSGINQGGNLGDDITYSGTVNAALEGTLLGIPSFAISLVSRTSSRFEPAADFARRLATAIYEHHDLPPDTFLNVNVPDLETHQIKSVRITRQGKRIYQVSIFEKTDHNGEKIYVIGGDEPGYEHMEDSDFEAIDNDCISITPLHLDLTNHASLDELKSWRF